MSQERLTELRKRLAARGHDAYVSLAQPNNFYLTGFRGSTSGVVVSADEAWFLCDFRYYEQAAAQVSDYEVDRVTGSLSARTGERLKTLGAIHAAFEPVYMTVAQAEAIQKTFGAPLEPDNELVATMRQVKSPREIQKVRDALKLAEGVLGDLTGTLSAGISERELAAHIEYELKKRGASGASFDTIVLFGSRTSLPHGEPGDARLQHGDVVLLDFGCRLDGYCSDLTRTYAFSTIPDTWFTKIYEIVLAAQRRALEAARPGITARELDAAARTILTEGGFGEYFGHGLGHGVGIEIHELPRLGTESDTILESGMVVTVEPGIYLPGRGGVRIEDVIAITDEGCEVLSSAPKELKVLSSWL